LQLFVDAWARSLDSMDAFGILRRSPAPKSPDFSVTGNKLTNPSALQGAVVIVTGVLLLSDPEVPISSMVVVPLGARREALQVMVTFELPFAGGVTGLAEAVADTPLGNPLTLKLTAELNPFTLVTVSVVDTRLPSSIVNEEGDRERVKFFVPEEAFTVRAMVVLCVVDPEVPVMVMVAVPTVADEDAVNVRVVVALPFAAGVTGLLEIAALTPLGNPLTLSVVAELNPPVLLTLMVLVPLPPCVTLTEEGDAPRLKFGDELEVPPASALSKPLPFGLPQPVAKSYPVVAEKPLLPLVMSWKSES
jgi:hypothetical protein